MVQVVAWKITPERKSQKSKGHIRPRYPEARYPRRAMPAESSRHPGTVATWFHSSVTDYAEGVSVLLDEQ